MRAERAAVRPLVYVAGFDGAVTLDVVAERFEGLRREQAVELRGKPGWGRSTILRHLAALLDGTGIVFLDEPGHAELMDELRERPVIFSSIPRAVALPQIVDTLDPAPWGMDQTVEYLLARHRSRIRDVMDAVMADMEFESLEGVPELVVTVLDRMAAAPVVEVPRTREVVRELLDAATRAVGHARYLEALCAPMLHVAGPSAILPRLTLLGPARLLRHHPMHLRLALDEIRRGLTGETIKPVVPRLDVRPLVRECINLAKRDDEFAAGMCRAIPKLSPMKVASAVSILHAAARPWLPAEGPLPRLDDARLPGWRPTRTDLRGLVAQGADLHGADLRGAALEGADFSRSNLAHALLARATLTKARFRACRLAGGDLTDVIADGAMLEDADLAEARFDRARAEGSSWGGSNLTGARFVRAQLQKAKIRRAIVEETDFSGADLSLAYLRELDLRTTLLGAVRFARTAFVACRLEGVHMVAPDLEGACFDDCDLTGTTMPNAAMREAALHRCGLMDVEWEGADLRQVDFRRSTFHAGSSRSGLVAAGHILPASEGSRTGFYTDDTGDQTHKAPEDIRKANLCGADLRGAHVFATDFYLVDLRRAKYDSAQAEWFRKCGAILRNK